MRPIATLAAKEFKDGMRNRWIIMITLLMAGLALTLALLGSVPTGSTKVSGLAVTIVSLSSLSIFFVPLIALLLSYDSLVGEADRGTLILLLAYPVKRSEIVLGKFCGQFALLSVALVVGYGSAGLTIAILGGDDWSDQAWDAFAILIVSSALLGAVFIAIGLALNARTNERGAAAGMAIAAWLFFALLYDLGLLAVLASDVGRDLSTHLVSALLLANPADAFRILNLAGHDQVAAVSGMAGVGSMTAIPAFAIVAVLLAWTVLPLTIGCLLFRGRQP